MLFFLKSLLRLSTRRLGLTLAVAAIVSSLAVPVANAAPSDANWVIKVAPPTSSTPSWIFPFQSGDTFTITNINYFQNLMYRPLYWFGTGTTNALNTSLSLATAPVYSNANKTVTITLKSGYKWSDGSAVRAQDVIFWLNLLATNPGFWAGYVPPLKDGTPLGLPDLLSSVTVPNASTVVLNLSRAVSPDWFTSNQLSQITPMPQAWDIEPTGTVATNFPARRPGLTGSLSAVGNRGTLATQSAGCWGTNWVGNGNHGPSSRVADGQNLYGADLSGTTTVVTNANATQAFHCAYVRYTLRSYAYDRANYATAGTGTARIWGVTDGPWRLKTYSYTSGAISFSPSSTYGGAKPFGKELQFVPCTTNDSCFNLMANGQVDSGRLPLKFVPPITSLARVGTFQPKALRTKGYTLSPLYSWVTNYFPMNFQSSQGANGKAKFIFAQQYFRQALQYLTDQKSMIAKHMNGYGYETYGPIPAKPANGYTKLTRSLYPYNVASAKSLLQNHGWSSATPATCLRPGTAANQCGAGIPQGTPLQFNLEFASGSDVLTGMVNSLHTTWAAGGISLTLTSVSYDTVVGDAFSGSTSWDFANWGGGWLYAPDYLPTGEPMFATGSAANTGGFSNATVDAMIKGTLFGGVTLASYENYTASQVPVIWMPSTVTLVEYRGIKGHDANPLDTFTPELWHH